MNSIVKVLRMRGHRRSDREISADAGLEGNLIACRVGGVHQMDLVDPASGSALARLVPSLHEPQIVAMQGTRMLVRGFDRSSDDPHADEYRQEWSIEVMAK
jgi:hypothetical protein